MRPMKFLILTLLAPLRWLVRLLLALLILFEEWGWEPLSRGKTVPIVVDETGG